MTVQQMIDKLSQIKDKSLIVVTHSDEGEYIYDEIASIDVLPIKKQVVNYLGINQKTEVHVQTVILS